MTSDAENRTWDAWRDRHQPFELNYHATEGVKWCSNELQFSNLWDAVFAFGGEPEGNVLDIGSGPRPPLAWRLNGDKTHAIDPLAAKYKEFAPAEWWNGVTVISHAAESLEERFANKMDYILCWNCLDHTIGWRQILDNIAKYAKKNAKIVVATDFHPSGIGHPGFPFDEFMPELKARFDIVKEQTPFLERDYAWVLKKKS